MKKRSLFKMIRACRVTWRGSDTPIRFLNEFLIVQLFFRGIPPEFHTGFSC